MKKKKSGRVKKERFFGKLKLLSTVICHDKYLDYVFLDYQSNKDLARQQAEFMALFYKRNNEWIRFKRETNNYIYVDDMDEIIILHEDWIKDITPVK